MLESVIRYFVTPATLARRDCEVSFVEREMNKIKAIGEADDKRDTNAIALPVRASVDLWTRDQRAVNFGTYEGHYINERRFVAALLTSTVALPIIYLYGSMIATLAIGAIAALSLIGAIYHAICVSQFHQQFEQQTLEEIKVTYTHGPRVEELEGSIRNLFQTKFPKAWDEAERKYNSENRDTIVAAVLKTIDAKAFIERFKQKKDGKDVVEAIALSCIGQTNSLVQQYQRELDENLSGEALLLKGLVAELRARKLIDQAPSQ